MNQIDKFKDSNGEINRDNIKKIIPYDDPFLMVDRVLKLDKKNIVAVKDVKKEEKYFNGHFKDFPIMPGALIVEGIGQAATMLVRYNIESLEKCDNPNMCPHGRPTMLKLGLNRIESHFGRT